MTARQHFTKEIILDAAFGLLRKGGWKNVTVRNIARALSASTMPVYSSKLTIDDIEWELKTRVWQVIQEYQTKPYTENPLSNVAVGLVMFAKKEPRLFRFLYIEKPIPTAEAEAEQQALTFKKAYGERKKLMEALNLVPETIKNPLMLKSWIFTLGLASLVATGALTLSDEKIIRLLEEAGGAFYFFQQQSGGVQ